MFDFCYVFAEAHRWTFNEPCTTSCWDKLKLSKLEGNPEQLNKLVGSHLIWNPENFQPVNGTGFSVGFWLSNKGNVSKGENCFVRVIICHASSSV